MRALLWCGALLLGLLAALPSAVPAADARLDQQQRQQRLIAQAEAERQRIEAEVAAERQRLAKDRAALRERLTRLRRQVEEERRQQADLAKELSRLRLERDPLVQQVAEVQRSLQTLTAVLRQAAEDTQALVSASPFTALQPDRDAALQPLLGGEGLPTFTQLETLRDLLLAELRQSGEVQRVTGQILDGQGQSQPAELLFLGPFTQAYRTPAGTVGFALYSPASRRLLALTQPPDGRNQRALAAYFAGESDAVPVDPGLGDALRQLGQRRGLGQQIADGGLIVWPILLIGLIAAVLVAERLWFLWRQPRGGDALLAQLQPCLEQHDWAACEQLCGTADTALKRVLAAGLAARWQSREEQENVLQEAILGEIPALERFLSTLAVLAAIAPLLGLLGTVTGMIQTFQIITLHGTGDPRLLSAGISEALVTTMLGLAVAIPILLLHSLLSRRVENRIAELEEKAIAFVNRLARLRLTGAGDQP